MPLLADKIESDNTATPQQNKKSEMFIVRKTTTKGENNAERAKPVVSVFVLEQYQNNLRHIKQICYLEIALRSSVLTHKLHKHTSQVNMTRTGPSL